MAGGSVHHADDRAIAGVFSARCGLVRRARSRDSHPAVVLQCKRLEIQAAPSQAGKRWLQEKDTRFLKEGFQRGRRKQLTGKGKKGECKKRRFLQPQDAGRTRCRSQMPRQSLRPAASWRSSQPDQRFDVKCLWEQVEQVHLRDFISHTWPDDFLWFPR